jgi:HPr kinase/phosphorylase
MKNSMTLHGVYMEVLGLGALLTGKSGIGKSELALGLIDRGHHLIADDAIEFNLDKQGHLIGCCPSVLQDFLEIRGIGILNIRAMFGDNAIQNNKRLRLIVRLEHFTEEGLHAIDRLHGMHTTQEILGIKIPEVTIPVTFSRNLAILVETAVRNELFKQEGYQAHEEFTKRLHEQMYK